MFWVTSNEKCTGNLAETCRADSAHTSGSTLALKTNYPDTGM